MFEELDNQIQLDLMHPKETDFDKEMHKELERKPSKRKRRMTLGQVFIDFKFFLIDQNIKNTHFT